MKDPEQPYRPRKLIAAGVLVMVGGGLELLASLIMIKSFVDGLVISSFGPLEVVLRLVLFSALLVLGAYSLFGAIHVLRRSNYNIARRGTITSAFGFLLLGTLVSILGGIMVDMVREPARHALSTPERSMIPIFIILGSMLGASLAVLVKGYVIQSRDSFRQRPLA